MFNLRNRGNAVEKRDVVLKFDIKDTLTIYKELRSTILESVSLIESL